MKTIGMLGGMSWESSSVYYQILNREVQRRLGGVASAKTLMYSFDFDDIAPLQHTGRWSEANARMADAARALERAGADFVIMCCNTMHCATAQIEAAIAIPFLHIADPLGEAIIRTGIKRAGLLGSRYTMTKDTILRGRLRDRFGIDLITPQGADADEVHRIVYEEFVRSRFLPASREFCSGVIGDLAAQGAQGAILGCTEFPQLIGPADSPLPLFDTTMLHAMAAVDFALA